MRSIMSFKEYLILLLYAASVGEMTTLTSKYVHRPTTQPVKKKTCDPSTGYSVNTCTLNDDCLKIGVGMKCIGRTCNCIQGSTLIQGQCITEKKIGSSCRFQAECDTRMGGLCDEDTGRCTCSPGLYEYKGRCYAGYRADIGHELVLNVNNYHLTSFPFRVSDKDEGFELIFRETLKQEEATVYFNKEVMIDNRTTINIGLDDKEQSTLCEVEADPLTNLYKIDLFGPRYEMTVSTSNGNSYQPVCSQINVLYALVPAHVTVTRTGNRASKRILIYPLVDWVSLVYGQLGEACVSSEDCKVESSFCDVTKKCACDFGYTAYDGICLQNTNTLGKPCATKKQCSIPHSTCTGRGVCGCVKGYLQTTPTSCIQEELHQSVTK